MRLLFSLPAYGLLAIVACFSLFYLRRAKPAPDQFCLWSTVAFLGYIVVRALFSPVPYLARADIYSVLGGLIAYLVVTVVLVRTPVRLLIITFLLVVAIAHVVIGAIQFRDADNFMLIPFLQRFDYGERASGFYICPNHLAGLLEVLGVFGLSIAFWSRWRVWAKLLVGYLAAICYVGVILTGSRGGYLSAAGSLLVFFALTLVVLGRADGRLSWKVGAATIIIAGIIGGCCFLLFNKSDFLSGRAGNVFEKTNMRVDLWQAALQQWKLQPFVGTGAGTYLFFGRQFRTDRVQVDPVEVHNDYLHLLAEYGVVGAIGFAIFLAAHLRRGWRTFQRLGPNRVLISGQLLSNTLAVNIGALCSVAAYVVHSAFDFNLHVPANVTILAFVFGLLANPGIERNGNAKTASVPIILSRLMLGVLGLIVAIQCARLLPGEYFAERARTALRDFHPADATLFATRGLALEQQNPDLYNYLGRARLDQGYRMSDARARASFYQAALEAFWKGKALAPRDENFALELGYTYDALDRFAEGEWMFEQAKALDPRSVATEDSYRAHIERWQKSGTAVK